MPQGLGDVKSGFIGEKVIRFESVSSVVDVAYTSSRYYHFNLNTENELDSTEKKLVGR